MYKRRTLCVVLSVFMILAVSCEKQGEQPVVKETMQAKKPAQRIDTVVSQDELMEKVTGGIEFDTAATPVYADGELYFTNTNFESPEKCRTMKIDSSGEFHILRKNNGLTSAIQHSGKGTFYCCEMLGHRVIEMDKKGKVLRVVAGEYNGRRIDGPNDLTVDSRGGIYFTDSQYIAGSEKMQETPAVYYVKPDGTVIRVIDDIEFPNGIELSPDEKTLYVANTRGKTKGRYVRAYDVLDDGTVANGRDFAELMLTGEEESKPDGVSGADGTAVDSTGNLYVATTRGLGIQVLSPEGKHLGNIECPSISNNVFFGGEDLKTLYVGAKDGIYKIRVKIPGLRVPKE